MPFTDSQLAGLVQLVLEQQKEIVTLKAGLVALIKIAHESGLEDVETRFQAYSADLVMNMIPETRLRQFER